jgi:hypothetical protein
MWKDPPCIYYVKSPEATYEHDVPDNHVCEVVMGQQRRNKELQRAETHEEKELAGIIMIFCR